MEQNPPLYIKDFFRLFWRHFSGFLSVVALFSLSFGCYVFFASRNPTYQSYGYLRVTAASTTEIQVALDEVAVSDDACTYVYDACVASDIRHSDGTTILKKEILEGTSTSYSVSSYSNRNKIIFSSKDKTICAPVLNKVMESVLKIAPTKYKVNGMNYLIIDSKASEAVTISGSYMKLFFGGVAAGLVFGTIFVFWKDKHDNRLLDAEEAKVADEPIVYVSLMWSEGQHERKIY